MVWIVRNERLRLGMPVVGTLRCFVFKCLNVRPVTRRYHGLGLRPVVTAAPRHDVKRVLNPNYLFPRKWTISARGPHMG